MKKLFYIIIILAGLGGGYYYWSVRDKSVRGKSEFPVDYNPTGYYGREDVTKQEPSKDSSNAATKDEPKATNTTPTTEAQGTYSTGEEGMAPDVLVIQVSYDGSKFEPASVDLKVGDIVIFKNNSDGDFWPASNDHPTHTLYSEFDAKQPISPGGKFQFKFEKAGSWGFHDHLHPQFRGVINVAP